VQISSRPDPGIWRSLADIPADVGRTAVVIGNFDGVHLGHQHVVREARRIADDEGLRVVAVTFDPHPMAVLRPEHAPSTLTDIETRAGLLRAVGVDDVLALPFDRGVAAWTPH
jgi:riboflavin kinase/FMN adenylyltransferase